MERGEVCDEFIDFHTVGHEPVDLQVAHILESFAKLDIHLFKMICLSRDNPSVMQKVFKLLQYASKEAQCPRLVDAPCLLHPIHTSFMVAVKSMDQVLVNLLGHLHGFFKTSTARREESSRRTWWMCGRSWRSCWRRNWRSLLTSSSSATWPPGGWRPAPPLRGCWSTGSPQSNSS